MAREARSDPQPQLDTEKLMPLVRIDHAVGKPSAYRAAISKGVHDAMTSTFNVPDDDRFQIIGEHAPGTIVHAPSYLGIDYSDELVVIQITCNEGRTLDQKKRLFAAIADNLVASPGLRREDVFVNLVEVKKENWSFGNGVAQYAT
jgi:phenylpyruvate tautomerase PptA (4-oxalocrotonate tautomerase family)